MKTIFYIVLVMISYQITSQTFTASGGPIPDDETEVCFDINVTGVGTIDANLGLESICINATHSWPGTLEFRLISPDGTSVTVLAEDWSLWDENLTNTCFSGLYSDTIQNANGPYTGNFVPSGVLAQFNNGQNADGTWQLCVIDNWNNTDAGTLDDVSITFSNNPSPFPPPTIHDCLGARPVCFTGDTFPQAHTEIGIYDEINDAFGDCYQWGERSSAWYTYTVQSAGEVNFTIYGLDPDDVFDYIVFDLTDASCADIVNDPSLNISCNNLGLEMPTGPNGNGDPRSEDPIWAEEGEVHYIYVSNFSTPDSGYIIDFAQSTAGMIDTNAALLDTVLPIDCNSDSIQFRFSENVLCSDIDISDFQIISPSGVSLDLENLNGIACSRGAEHGRNFTIIAEDVLTEPGIYTLSLASGATIIDNCGNQTTQVSAGSITFELNPLGVNAVVNGVTCYNDNDGSATVTVPTGVAPFSYSWDDPSNQTTQTATSLGAGDYIITVTDAVGCIARDTITIDGPSYTFSNDTTICQNGCANLSINESGGAAPISYTWTNNVNAQSDNGATQTYCPTSETIYTVNIQDNNGCSAQENITVSKYAPLTGNLVTFPNNPEICEGDSISMQASINGGLLPYTYTWNGSTSNNDTNVVYPNQTGSFPIYVTDNCESDTLDLSINVTVHEVPELQFTANDTSLCLNEELVIANATTPSPAFYTVYYGESNSDTTLPAFDTIRYTYSVPGQYDLRVQFQTNEGCEKDTTISNYVKINRLPVANFIAENNHFSNVDSSNCFFGRSDLAQNHNWILNQDTLLNSNEVVCFNYDEDSLCYNIAYIPETVYGCRDTIVKQYCFSEAFYVHVPTAFSPNGDGLNDFFNIKTSGITKGTFLFQVFSRYGNLIYETKSTDAQWDGTSPDSGAKKPVADGVYVWKMVVYNRNGKKEIRHGTVTVVK